MKTALYIGRFQPFHNGHLQVVKDIIKENDRVIIVIGSAEKNFLPKDPLTAGERFTLIEESLIEAEIPAEKYAIIPVTNINNYALWVKHIDIHLPNYDTLYTGSNLVRVCFENASDKKHLKIHHLDRTKIPVSATQVRQGMLDQENWESLVPPAVSQKLKKWHIPKRLLSIQ